MEREISRSSRAGARAGRGFRYQDAATAYLCVLGYIDQMQWTVAPEAGDDATLFGSELAMQLQIKSRRYPKAETSPREFGSWLIDLWRAHGDVDAGTEQEMGIITDQRVNGVMPTGLDGAFAPGDLARVGTSIKDEMGLSDSDIDRLTARTHLVHFQDPITAASDKLASHLNVPPAVGQVLVRRIQAAVGQLVDEDQSATNRRGLSQTDVARLIDDTLALVDLDAVELAVRQGLCEHVDFLSSVDDEGFYLGKDVVPGHIGAGLVISRPSEVEDVLAILESERLAVVAGPSGIGKSALAWLTAYASRNAIRWLRVRPTTTLGDVTALLRFAEALRADPRAPVGFVVDDIRDDQAFVWDLLAQESRHRPEIYLLGTVREEELDVISQAPPSTLIRPRLTEKLAEALWNALKERGQTEAAAWREPFLESNGLLLEFVHILTTGSRLPDVIRAEVDARRREERHSELNVLRATTFGAARGGLTRIDRLQAELGIDSGDMQNILARLLDEHLIGQLDPETIGGLHQLRSEAIVEASHRIPPPTLSTTARLSLLTTDVQHLPFVSAKAVDEGLLAEEDVRDTLLQRLQTAPSPDMLSAYLDSIRQIAVNAAARTHLSIMQEEGILPAQQQVALQLALIKAEPLESFSPEIRRALPRLSQVEVVDGRLDAIEAVEKTLMTTILGQVNDLQTALRVLSSMQGLEHFDGIDLLQTLGRVVTDLSFQDLSRFLGTAREVSISLALGFRESSLGDTEAALEQVRQGLPWITSVALDEQGERVEAKWLFIGASAQDDPHELVVGNCFILAGLFPEAETIAITAVDPTGEPAGFGDVRLADKAIPRSNLASPEQIRWHRALLNSFASLAIAQTKTERLIAESELLEETVQIVEDLALRWLRGQPMTSAHIERLNSLTTQALDIASIEHLPDDPLTRVRHTTDVGDVATLCRNLCGNAFPRLFESEKWALAAFLFDTISPLVGSILGENYWSLLEEGSDEAVQAIQTIVLDLHTVLCHRLQGIERTSRYRRAIRRTGRQALSSAAAVAMEQGLAALDSRVQQAERALQTLGYESEGVVVDASKPSGVCWPSGDVILRANADSLFSWMADSERIVDSVGPCIEDVRQVAIGPAKAGLLLPHLAISAHRVKGYVLPFDAELIAKHFPITEQAEIPTLQRLEKLVDASLRMATLADLEETRALTDPEREAVDEAENDLKESAGNLISAAQDDTSDFLSEVLKPIFDLIASRDVHTRLTSAINGADPDTMGLLVTIRLALAEWDVDPGSAYDHLQAFLEAAGEADDPSQAFE